MSSLSFSGFCCEFWRCLCPVNLAEFVIDNGIPTTEDVLKSNVLNLLMILFFCLS